MRQQEKDMRNWLVHFFQKIVAEMDKQKKNQESGKRNTVSNLQSISKSVDQFYIYLKLRIYCEYIANT